MKNRIIAEAPMRVDLAGGTIDLPPLFLLHYPAMTVNAAIGISARASVEAGKKFVISSVDQGLTAEWDSPEKLSWEGKLALELLVRLAKSFSPKENLKIEVRSTAPAGSGLGGSSAIAVALVAALAKWHGREFSDAELVEYAKSVETQTIKVPTGYQDYWAAVHGGVAAYRLGFDGSLVREQLGSPSFRKELEKYCMLVYVGKPHFSGTNNWGLFKKHIDGDAATIRFFETLKENAVLMRDALASENMEKVTVALNRDWQTRKAMLPEMTTPEIEELMREAFRSGAFGGRVCGAGAGGCALLLIDPAKRGDVEDVVQKLQMRVLPFSIAERGVRVVLE